MVQASEVAVPVTAVGQVFTMGMSHPLLGSYTSESLVVELERFPFVSAREMNETVTRLVAACP